MKTTKSKAPFGWVGGKSKLAKDIIILIPEHKLYVEVFGGALNVLWAKERSKIEVVNDINSDLINLHRVIRTNPQTLNIYLNKMLISRELFEDIKHKRYKPKNNIEKAAIYYYKLAMSFGSKGDNFAMTKSRKAKNIYKNFSKWSKRLKFVTIENLSFEKIITQYDSKDTFFYLDPPYYATEHYYKNTGGFSKDKHIELSKLLKTIKGRFLLSYNDCNFIRSLYKGFNIQNTKDIQYTLGKNMHKKSKIVKEIFIKNY